MVFWFFGRNRWGLFGCSWHYIENLKFFKIPFIQVNTSTLHRPFQNSDLFYSLSYRNSRSSRIRQNTSKKLLKNYKKIHHLHCYQKINTKNPSKYCSKQQWLDLFRASQIAHFFSHQILLFDSCKFASLINEQKKN